MNKKWLLCERIYFFYFIQYKWVIPFQNHIKRIVSEDNAYDTKISKYFYIHRKIVWSVIISIQ